MKKICTCSLDSEFPEDCKFYPADTEDELHKVSINRHRQLSKVEFVLLVTFRSNICYAFMRQGLASSLFNLFFEVSHAFTSLFCHYIGCSSCVFSRSKESRCLTGEINDLT